MAALAAFGVTLGVVGFFVASSSDESLLLELSSFCFLEGVGLVGVCFFTTLGVFDFLLGSSSDESDESLLELSAFFFAGVDLPGVPAFGVTAFFAGSSSDESDESLLELSSFFFCAAALVTAGFAVDWVILFRNRVMLYWDWVMLYRDWI